MNSNCFFQEILKSHMIFIYNLKKKYKKKSHVIFQTKTLQI